MNTILDYNPYFAYARYINQEPIKNPVDFIVNLDKNFPYKEIKSNTCPQLAKFGNGIYILGSNEEVSLGSSYILNHPDDEYIVNVYEDEDVVRNRFMSTFGISYEMMEHFDEDHEHTNNLFKNNKVEESNSDQLSRLLEQSRTSEIAIYLRKYITSYVSSPDKSEIKRCPYLVGHSGIAKSAIVYEVANKLNEKYKNYTLEDLQKSDDPLRWGFRVVEIRAGFLDKVDLLGYSTIVSVERKDDAWTDSPKKEFLLCCTDFVNQCRDWLMNYKGPITEENKYFIAKMKYFAMTPILFFDEINRAVLHILYQIMLLISEHKLKGYDISIAPKICASNDLVDMEDMDEETKSLFNYNINKMFVESGLDLSMRSRFDRVTVSGNDVTVISYTYSYLKNKFKDSEVCNQVLDYAYKNKILYNHKMIDQYGKFPTFRGWEDLCNYLVWIEKQRQEQKEKGVKEKDLICPLKQIIWSLLGEKVDLKNTIPWMLIDSNSTNIFLKHTLDSGLPCALLGRLGIAKTSKIMNYIKDKEKSNEIIRYESTELCAQDKTTISGYPVKVDFLTEVFSDNVPPNYREFIGIESYDVNDDDAQDCSEFKEFSGIYRKNPNVALETTAFKPYEPLLRKILELKKAKAEGKKVRLVLFFDEVNKCNPIVQSSIFEAISLKKYFGVSFEDIDVSIVAAGNWQSKHSIEMSGEVYKVTPLDTAMLHRFSTKFIDEMSDEDIHDFMKYLKDKHPISYSIFGDMYRNDFGRLKSILNYLPNVADTPATLDTNVFTLRELLDIENKLLQYDYDVTSGLTMDSLDKIISILELPDYVLNKHIPDDVVDWSVNEDVRKYFITSSTKESYTYSMLVKDAIKLFNKVPPLDKNVINDILTFIQYHEKDQLSLSLYRRLKENIPVELYDSIISLVENYLINKSLFKVSTKQQEFYIFSENDDNVVKACNLILSNLPPSDAISELYKAELINNIKKSHDKIPIERINKAIEVYNKSEEARSGDLFIDSGTFIYNILDSYGDKILIDKHLSVSLNLEDIITDNFDLSYKVILNGILFPNFFLNKSVSSTVKFYPNYISLSSKHHIPDLYSLVFVLKQGKNEFSDVVTFDDTLFKVKVEKKQNKLLYTYFGKFSCYDFVIKVDVELDESIISKDVLDNQDALVHKNFSGLLGIVKTFNVHGGVLSDIPEIDSEDIKKLDNFKLVKPKKSLIKKDKKEDKEDTEISDKSKTVFGNIIFMYKRSFSKIMKLFV